MWLQVRYGMAWNNGHAVLIQVQSHSMSSMLPGVKSGLTVNFLVCWSWTTTARRAHVSLQPTLDYSGFVASCLVL